MTLPSWTSLTAGAMPHCRSAAHAALTAVDGKLSTMKGAALPGTVRNSPKPENSTAEARRAQHRENHKEYRNEARARSGDGDSGT
jgi:hypothetical protein